MSDVSYRRAAGTSFRQAGGEVFLVGPDGQTLFNLNQAGSAIWQLLEEPTDAAEAADILAEAFPGVERTRIFADVAAIFAELKRQGLIEPA